MKQFYRCCSVVCISYKLVSDSLHVNFFSDFSTGNVNNTEWLLSSNDVSDKQIIKRRDIAVARLHFKLNTIQHNTAQTNCLI